MLVVLTTDLFLRRADKWLLTPITVIGLVGSAVGLVVAGVLAQHFGHIGPGIAVVAVGPLALAVILLAAYPETARRELEEINPEDLPPD